MKRPNLSVLTRPGYLLLALVLVLAIGWAHQAFFSDTGMVSEVAETSRIVVVGSDTTPSTPDELHGTLVAGTLPSGVHDAEVLSDRDCAPDAKGVSHCLNGLALASTRITIRHHHRMSEVACLEPGETVTVMDEATYADRQGS